MSVGQVLYAYISWSRATTTLQKLYQLVKGKIGFKIILKKARVRVLKKMLCKFIDPVNGK
jgi:hypothetical protein